MSVSLCICIMCGEYFEKCLCFCAYKKAGIGKSISQLYQAGLSKKSFFFEICFHGKRHQICNQTQLWEHMIKLCANGNETWFLMNICAFDCVKSATWQFYIPTNLHFLESVIDWRSIEKRFFPCFQRGEIFSLWKRLGTIMSSEKS